MRSIQDLLALRHADRKLRAYAYLTVSFNDRRSTQDILDCLLPFVIAGVQNQAGSLLDLSLLVSYVESIGIRIPLYVLEQLIPRLQASGAIEWNAVAKRHVCVQLETKSAVDYNPAPGLSEAFREIDEKLSHFAEGLGVVNAPVSGAWPDALISFLKSDNANEVMKSVKVKGALIGDVQQVESFVIARFIQNIENSDRLLFDRIVEVFTGVLIEEFLANIQIIGTEEKYSGLSIFYDTNVLLRLLGTSGRLLQSATMEMHRALQDLGCKTLYLDVNEVEVYNILETILNAHSSGQELFGETAEAISDRDIAIADVRDISSTFTVRLGQLNIFQYSYISANRKSENIFQIDEHRFADALASAALLRDRTYKRQNAETDARAVAIIFRLRRGQVRRAISSSGYIFISRNNLLQKVSSKFASENVEGYDERSVPPVLTIGQITTIAWLATAKVLEPQKVSKELLGVCYNAVKPSPNWADEFAKALQKFQSENPEYAQQRANQIIFLDTARNTAREASVGQAAVLRKINLTEIFQRASTEADRRAKEDQSRFEELKIKSQIEIAFAEEQAEARALEQAKAQSKRDLQEGVLAVKSAHEIKVAQASAKFARILIRIAQILLLIVFVLISYLQINLASPEYSKTIMIFVLVLFVINALSFLDLLGWEVVASPVRSLEEILRKKIISYFK